MKSFCTLRVVLVLLLGFVLGVSCLAQNHLVISQLYGGGGNTGAVYSNDFVELYNPTSNAVNLSAYSLQYASATSTSAFSSSNTLILSGTIQPGKYFLIQLAAGTTTPAALPTPDFAPTSFVLNLSGTTGKLALVQGTTALTTSCPTAAQATDFVGWGPATGTTANCSYNDSTGVNRAPATTNSTGLYLNASNTWTGVNKNDYTAGTPHPRNSTYGSGASQLTITGTAATPASVTQGSQTTLSVTVAPGQSTTGTAVQVNLSAIGGSAAQALSLTSGNTYAYTYTVPSTVAPGSYTLPVTVTSSDPTVTGSINLTVTAFVALTPISAIQANRFTYVGGAVKVQGVITVVTTSGYYLQTPSATPGSTGDEGILVYSGTGSNPATAVVGNLVTVQGNLTLFPAATASHTPSLEITGASLTVNATGQTLPAPITLPANFPTAGGGIYQLTAYESMLVKLPSVTAIGPTDGSLTEVTETATSTGQFYAVATGTARPFREPGMDFRDYPTPTCPSVTNCTATATSAGVARPANVVLFDDNPERLIIETSLGGGAPLDVSTGAVLTNITGVVDFTYATDVPYGDPARIILQPGQVTGSNFTPGVTVQPLAVPGSNQVTIAAFNIERFFNTSSSDDKYFNAATGNVGTSLAVDVTPAAYARRLAKVSLAIRTVLNTPDVLAIEEVENKSVLQDIAAQIDSDARSAGQTAPGYVAYGTDSVTTYTNDVGGISVGFLVKPSSTNVARWEQIGATSTFTASSGRQTLNDRPSQVLHVGFKRSGGASDYPMTLIVNHLRSLSGIATSADTRLKKELQAELLANTIQGYQTNGERVLAMGDMNAFEFSDGYTDTLGTITGRVTPGAAAQPGAAIVNPAATNLVTTLAPADRRSYVEFGNSQVLDHVVATSNVLANTTLAYAHLNADFPEIYTNDATTPARTSDHDAALTYLTVPAPIVTGTLTGSGNFPGSSYVGTNSAGQQITFTNTGEAAIAITSITTTGNDFSQSNNCGTSLAVGSTCQVNVVFKPTTTGTRTGTLTVSSTATNLSAVTLMGTGTPAPLFTVAVNGSSSPSVTVPRGRSTQLTVTVTPASTFSGTVYLSCTNLPANTSCNFGATPSLRFSANSGPQSATFTVTTQLNPGTYTFNVAATSSRVLQTVPVTLNVQ